MQGADRGDIEALEREELLFNAYHEAGHAIMAIAWGWPLQLVSIRPQQLGPWHVRVGQMRPSYDHNMLGRLNQPRAFGDPIREAADILVAGHVAGKKLRPRFDDPGTGTDRAMLAAICRNVPGYSSAFEVEWRAAEVRVTAIFQIPEIADRLDSFARRLVEEAHLTGRRLTNEVSRTLGLLERVAARTANAPLFPYALSTSRARIRRELLVLFLKLACAGFAAYIAVGDF